jgi:ribosomal protein L11 methyltransferase
VLLQEIATYASYLAPSGALLLSGFYTNDISDLNAKAVQHGLKEEKRDEKEGWASLLLRK